MRLSWTGLGTAGVALLLIVAAACGGSGSTNLDATRDAASEGSAPGTVTAEGGLDAGTPDDAATADDAGCPATYAAATGSCTRFAAMPSANDPACNYPEGTCRCVDRVTCGPVVVPIEGDAAAAPQWRCSAPRTDGCPEQNPAGQTCADAQKTCSYPNGCCTDIAACTNGRWVSRPGACPL